MKNNMDEIKELLLDELNNSIFKITEGQQTLAFGQKIQVDEYLLSKGILRLYCKIDHKGETREVSVKLNKKLIEDWINK